MARKIKNYLFTFILITFLGSVSYGQKLTIKLADKRFNEFAYMEAIQLYEYAYEKDTLNNYLLKQLAESNRRTGNNQQVERWLKKLIDRHLEQTDDIYNYFQALKSNGKYESAEYWLNKYSSLISKENKGKWPNSFLSNIELLKNDSLNYEILNVSLNTIGSELGPVYYKDRVVFSSTSIKNNSTNYKWNELPFLQMYSAKIDPAKGDLTLPEPFAPKLRTTYHDGPVSFDENNEIIYFTRNNIIKGKTARSKDGVVNLKIFLGKLLTKGEWTIQGEFKYNSNEYSVGHPSINQDGTILFFASDMPGGYGKSDIYYSTRTNDEWGMPINLGPSINTMDNESFPFISNEGTLYFASDRYEGLGGMDIYFSAPDKGVFTASQNMGYPINSSYDDFGLTFEASCMKGYFCSNRPGGKGDDDLYYLKIKSDSIIIRGVVKERGTNELIADATVSLMDINGTTVMKRETTPNGEFGFKIRSKQQYVLNIAKHGYFESIVHPTTVSRFSKNAVKQEVFLEKITEKPMEVSLSKITSDDEEGPVQMIELEHINYDLDKSFIRKDAAAILDKLIAYWKASPDLNIKVESHTDSRATDEYNLLLSKRRAVAAFDYMVSKGIDPDRISYYGFGEARLLNVCGNGVICDEKKHEENRRSIVKVFRRVKENEKL